MTLEKGLSLSVPLLPPLGKWEMMMLQSVGVRNEWDGARTALGGLQARERFQGRWEAVITPARLQTCPPYVKAKGKRAPKGEQGFSVLWGVRGQLCLLCFCVFQFLKQ